MSTHDVLATVARRLELKEVRKADPKLPGVVGFRGEFLVDALLKTGELRLQIVGLRQVPAGFDLFSGVPARDATRITDPELAEKAHVVAENPARALRIVSRPSVKKALLSLLGANARVELRGPTLQIRARALDAEAAVPVANSALALMEALADGCREDDLATATKRETARSEPVPAGQQRRFVAVSAAGAVSDEKLEDLRRLARALVYWRNRTSEMREQLMRNGATGLLADELLAEALPARRAELRGELLVHLGASALMAALSSGLAMALLPGSSELPRQLLARLLPSAVSCAASLVILIRGIFRYMTALQDAPPRHQR